MKFNSKMNKKQRIKNKKFLLISVIALAVVGLSLLVFQLADQKTNIPSVLAAPDDYYVDANSIGGSCSDTNPGTITRPWCSISKANSTLQPGDTAYIRAGTYRETIRAQRSVNL